MKVEVTESNVEELRVRFSKNCLPSWWDTIRSRYSESQRRYHTLSHLKNLLSLLDTYPVHNPLAVELAIWFHDVIYDPTRHDNEEQSIVVFEKYAVDASIEPTVAEEVTTMIRATISHKLPETGVTDDLKLFLDFDLEVLSWLWSDYEEYSKAIRQEYIHMPDSDYTAGRAGVLERFLGRPRLYFSEEFFATREQRARGNLRKEIEILKQQ
ncbi:hypothetical protein SmJEL517_g01023 [Synchytrium microbalum]|uniref:HD domain-containing protein n=1 Tax=Synchytrium microbalum TaxID=1806994 RepID=A0A507C7F4_9FUNG|nr:uncharacterized protein SmJEL517_g01023 [Synchytrium microbalum]TPX36977.1 hypothetical protein SmJEL517_g01023 [Synchytrium microbalum]